MAAGYPIGLAKLFESSGVVDVPTGEVAAVRGEILLVSALGSCVAVAALDVEETIGGIAHVMLPGKSPSKERQMTKYADDGIKTLISAMRALGASVDRFEFFLLGGGNVLRREDDVICVSNIESVTGTSHPALQFAKARGYPLRGLKNMEMTYSFAPSQGFLSPSLCVNNKPLFLTSPVF